MRKGYVCLLAVVMVIASIMIAGCTTSNQANQASSSETSNATTTAAANTTTAVATTTSSSVASVSPTVTTSPSATPTVATPTPSASQKTATSIQFTSNPSVRKGQSLGINVISSVSGLRICAPGLVSATIGTVTSGGSDCYSTAFLNTGNLNPGTYDVTLNFAGDSTYQPSQSTIRMTITA